METTTIPPNRIKFSPHWPHGSTTPLVTNEVMIRPVKPTVISRDPIPAMLADTQPLCSSGKILGKNEGALAKLEENERKG